MGQVMVPVAVDTQQMQKIILDAVSEALKEREVLITKSYEFPPYIPQEELKDKLGIGQDKLNKWYSMGLKKQIWSPRDHRVERSELQRFLRDNFQV